MRQVLLFIPGEPVTCPAGHELPSPPESPGLCGCAGCGRWVWVYTHGDGARTVVEIDEQDRRIIERGHLTLAQVRDYLGLGRRRSGPVARTGHAHRDGRR